MRPARAMPWTSAIFVLAEIDKIEDRINARSSPHRKLWSCLNEEGIDGTYCAPGQGGWRISMNGACWPARYWVGFGKTAGPGRF